MLSIRRRHFAAITEVSDTELKNMARRQSTTPWQDPEDDQDGRRTYDLQDVILTTIDRAIREQAISGDESASLVVLDHDQVRSAVRKVVQTGQIWWYEILRIEYDGEIASDAGRRPVTIVRRVPTAYRDGHYHEAMIRNRSGEFVSVLDASIRVVGGVRVNLYHLLRGVEARAKQAGVDLDLSAHSVLW